MKITDVAVKVATAASILDVICGFQNIPYKKCFPKKELEIFLFFVVHYFIYIYIYIYRLFEVTYCSEKVGKPKESDEY
jgi:hypothetical protein